MAKIIFLILISILVVPAWGEELASPQTSNELSPETFLAQGRYEASGTFSFKSEASSGSSNFFLRPSVGYFIKDRLSINAGLGMNYSSSTSQVTGDISAGASYYFKLAGPIAPFVSQDFYQTYGSSETSNGGLSTFGALLFLRPNVALKSGFSYVYNFEQSLNEGSFEVTSGLSFFF